MTKDEKYIYRCLQLASFGRCNAAPNPMVGAVIVHQDKIIGEGYHARCGEAHAEVNAIRSVKDESLLHDSTIYVSLEPCSHYGKTPPCADLIIQKGIPRVVVGCMDPFALVAGRGIQKLRDAGIEVTVGVLEKECIELNKRFITFHTHKRPYITLKWAESADGFIDINRTEGSPVVLSNAMTSQLVHKKRAEYQGIMVGRKTALLDNPSLTTRHWFGKNPVRMVIDKELSLPESLHLFDGKVQTLVFTQSTKEVSYPNTEIISINFGQDILPQMLNGIYQRKIQSIIVEGGCILLQSFIDSGLWDEAFIEVSPVELTDGVKAPSLPSNLKKSTELHFGRFIHHLQH